MEDKHRNLLSGIEEHYTVVCNSAFSRREELMKENPLLSPIPVIAMGHLFTARGSRVEGDGVRELYVGSLACVDESTFPPFLDYVALGHLHVPQIVGGKDHIRYSGSPVPMGFGEANQKNQWS